MSKVDTKLNTTFKKQHYSVNNKFNLKIIEQNN